MEGVGPLQAGGRNSSNLREKRILRRYEEGRNWRRRDRIARRQARDTGIEGEYGTRRRGKERSGGPLFHKKTRPGREGRRREKGKESSFRREDEGKDRGMGILRSRDSRVSRVTPSIVVYIKLAKW